MTIEDIALTMTPGIGVKGVVHLLEVFGDAHRIFAATDDELITEAALRADLAQRILRRVGFSTAEQEMLYCDRNEIRGIASTDPEYPSLLREIPDYPHVLYIKGNAAALTRRCISIVGTRKPTSYGQELCSDLVEKLAERIPELCIVSGLAYGIDVGAHLAALSAGATTVGVISNPLPKIIPVQHTAIARDIVGHGGAIVSEFHSQTRQNGTGYLPRNRIIAALSAGTIVVEAGSGSGSLHTARYADDYNRSVMAFPGCTTSPKSAGTNQLIRNQKARLISSAQDVIEELRWELELPPQVLRPKPLTTNLIPDESELLEYFTAGEPMSVETLGQMSGRNPGELSALLVGLELSGAIDSLPGNRYIRQR